MFKNINKCTYDNIYLPDFNYGRKYILDLVVFPNIMCYPGQIINLRIFDNEVNQIYLNLSNYRKKFGL